MISRTLGILALSIQLSLVATDNMSPKQKQYLQEVYQDYEFYSQNAPKTIPYTSVAGKNFKQEVLTSKQPVLILVSAVWCGPCQLLKPIFTAIAAQYTSDIKFVHIEYDSYPSFVQQHQIDGVPTFVLYHQGKVIDTFPAFQSARDLEACFKAITQKFKSK